MMMQMRVYMIGALVWAEAPKRSALRTTSVICTLVDREFGKPRCFFRNSRPRKPISARQENLRIYLTKGIGVPALPCSVSVVKAVTRRLRESILPPPAPWHCRTSAI